MASNVFTLTVRRGPDEGQSFTIAEDNITIGRDPVVDIVLNDPEVSRQHARLMRVDDGFQIQDLGSTNGTFVDGKRLAGDPVELAPGMVITMGSNVSLVYRASADPMATVVSPDAGADLPQAESEAAAADEMGEEPEAMAEDAPVVEAFETPMPEPIEPAEPEENATALEFPPVEEPESLPPAEEDDELPSFEEFGAQASPDERTVLDMEAQPSAFADYEDDYDRFEADKGDELPSFGQEEELPSYEDVGAEPEPSAYTPQPESIDRSPPPPPPPSPPEQESGRNRNLIIAVVIILLLLCCCCLLGYVAWTYGDLLLNYMEIQ